MRSRSSNRCCSGCLPARTDPRIPRASDQPDAPSLLLARRSQRKTGATFPSDAQEFLSADKEKAPRKRGFSRLGACRAQVIWAQALQAEAYFLNAMLPNFELK